MHDIVNKYFPYKKNIYNIKQMPYKLNIPGTLILIPINIVKNNPVPVGGIYAQPGAYVNPGIYANSAANVPISNNNITTTIKSLTRDQTEPTSLQENTKTGLKSLNKGLDTIFHDTIDDIKEQSNAYFPQSKSINVTDANGKKIKIEIPKNGAGFTYYEPGSYKYSAESYVPDYEDSVVLSRSIGLVPRLKGEFFLPAEVKYLNSIETNYKSSDSLIISSNKYALKSTTYNREDDQEAKLTVDYPIEKTDEELEYEDRVAHLLSVQNEIVNYATPAPMNVQTKIPKRKSSQATPTSTVKSNKPTLGPSVLQKNKKDVFKIGAGAPTSTNYLLMTSDQ